MNLDTDDDGPPLLVAAADSVASQEPVVAQLQDLDLVKVPITIVTEFGDCDEAADIEKTVTVNKDGQQVEEWLELANGCICCSVKDAGVNAIESLMKRRGAFDYILLETTGLADPGNIAPLFWVDDALGSSIYLDGIVTLVDAKNILLSLDERPTEAPADEHDHQGPHLTTAHLQISHADVVVINKSDLVSAEQLQTVALRIKAINSLAKIHIARYGQVPHLEGLLLDLHAYDKVGSLDIADKGHSHLDPSISTTKIDFSPLTDPQLKLLDAWLRSVLWDSKLPVLSSAGQEDETIPTFEIHRLKGRIMTAAGSFKMIQGVREVFEITNVQEQPEQSGSTGRGKIVLIGRGLSGLPWQASMATALDATTNVFGDQPSMLDQ